MSADVVVLESLTLWPEVNVPPSGVITGAAAVDFPFNRPYTYTAPLVTTYTLPFVTTGMANFMACAVPFCVELVSLSQSIRERSVASKAYRIDGPWSVYWSVRNAQAIPSCAPFEETEKEAPGNAEETVDLLEGVVFITPLFSGNAFPTS